MSDSHCTWAIVLAGGEGTRLRNLTVAPCGTAVPKQFCSLQGDRSLLEDAIERAAAIVDRRRICSIVAEQHHRWWSRIAALSELPERNVIVQPANLGTAIGIAYALTHIVARSPNARVLLLPADHYVRSERILGEALHRALGRLAHEDDRVVLLGFEPDEPDTELGYIVPGSPDRFGGYEVARFVEKPDPERAQELITKGGLWNAFIIAGQARTILDLFREKHAPVLKDMRAVVHHYLRAGAATDRWQKIVDLYRRLPSLDFSRDLLERSETLLRVVRVPHCGWSDLGTPRRLGRTLQRFGMRADTTMNPSSAAFVNLALQHERICANP